MEAPARSSTHRDSYMTDHQFHTASLESASTSAEEMSSSTVELEVLHPAISEPINSSVWEGWTQLKISSSSTHHPLMQDQTTSHSTMSSETYNHHQQDSFLSNWNITSSMVTQPASGSATPYMDHMKHPSTTTGSSSSFGMLSPTRFPSTDNAGTRFNPESSSSDQSSFIFSELMRSMRNNVDNPVTSAAASTSRHHQHIIHAADGGTSDAYNDQGKSYEEGSLQFSNFGGSKVVGTDSAASHHQNLVLQMPISPESPISPLDLNNVVQQQQPNLPVKDQTLSRHPAESWPASSNSIAQQQLSERLHISGHTREAACNQFYNSNNNTSTLARSSLEDHHHPSSDLESSPNLHLDEFPAQRSSSKLGRRSLDAEVMMNIPLPSSLQSPSPIWSQLISSDMMSHGVNNSVLPNVTSTDNIQYQTFSGMTCTSNSSSAHGKSKMGHAHVINPMGSVKGARLESSSLSGKKRSSFEVIKKPAQAAKDKTRIVEPALASYSAKQTVEVMAAGPALNTNGKPRARRGSATDPQSVYARNRRKKIDERLKTLQGMVPNGAKVDIVTMLDEAYNYVKFLESQVELLKSDDFWMFATPIHRYNNILS